MTNEISRKLMVLFLISVIGFTPALSYAKNDKENKGRDNDDKSEVSKNKNNGSCLRAFGHLFAPGFIKNWGERDFLWNCFLPFGIGKKFSGTNNNASSTLDTIPPVISNLWVKANTTKATITWTTNEKSDSAVFWSTSVNINVNSTSTASSTKSEMTKDHKIEIENLTVSTTYYIIIRSKDSSSNTSLSSETSFKTKTLTPDSTPPVVSEVTLLVGTSTVNVGWKTNENATSRVYYGISIGLDVNASTTSYIENSTPKKIHTIILNNLSTSTSYYIAIESRDASGNRTVTPTFTATTGGL